MIKPIGNLRMLNPGHILFLIWKILVFVTSLIHLIISADTLAEHVISQVLYSASPVHGKQNSASDFVLKVYDRAEYLDK